FRARLLILRRSVGAMGGLSHEDYYPRLCDRSLWPRDDRLGTLGSLLSDQGKGLGTPPEGLHTDDPNNSCRSCPDWPCAGLAALARDPSRDASCYVVLSGCTIRGWRQSSVAPLS